MRVNRMLVAAAVAMALGASDSSLGHGYYRGYWGGYYGPRVGVYWGAPWYWGAASYWGGPWYGYGYPYGYAYRYGYGYPYAYGYPGWRYDYPAPYAVPPSQYVEPAPSATSSGAWYYCSDPPGYFPHVKLCSKPWLEVAPFATSENAGPPRRSP